MITIVIHCTQFATNDGWFFTAETSINFQAQGLLLLLLLFWMHHSRWWLLIEYARNIDFQIGSPPSTLWCNWFKKLHIELLDKIGAYELEEKTEKTSRGCNQATAGCISLHFIGFVLKSSFSERVCALTAKRLFPLPGINKKPLYNRHQSHLNPYKRTPQYILYSFTSK